MAMGGLLVVLASASAAAACLAAGSGQPRERLATIGLEGFLEKAGAAYVIGRLSADGRKAREKKEALAQMPVMIDVVVLGLSAGLSFDSSLELYCSRYGDALSRELGHALLSWRMGAETRGEALERAASSLSVPQLARFGSVVCESLAFGSPLAETLERQAQVMRDEQRSLVEEEIERVPVKMLIPLGTLIVPAMLLAILGPLLGGALRLG